MMSFVKDKKIGREVITSFRGLQFNKAKFCREIPPIQVAPVFITDYRDPTGALFFRKPPMPFTIYIYIYEEVSVDMVCNSLHTFMTFPMSVANLIVVFHYNPM